MLLALGLTSAPSLLPGPAEVPSASVPMKLPSTLMPFTLGPMMPSPPKRLITSPFTTLFEAPITSPLLLDPALVPSSSMSGLALMVHCGLVLGEEPGWL